ncbi:hypothetical protein pEaSNUABM11_00221 [Erwinia phage pEa_SNUABM_11]|nr:hypothetical protein pEaSNUABM11_00221 [Erwinia phage pEa_SNUABM_11]
MDKKNIPYLRVDDNGGDDVLPVDATSRMLRHWMRYLRYENINGVGVSEVGVLVGLNLEHFEVKYLRTDLLVPAIWRVAYMFQWAKVDIERTWDSLAHDQSRLQVMHVIELMHRKAVPHEGLDAVFASWQKRNK